MKLTKRQREVIRLTSLGCTIEEIAAILYVSRSTADVHRVRLNKLFGLKGVQGPAMLTRYAIEQGIISLDDELTADEEARKRCAKRS